MGGVLQWVRFIFLSCTSKLVLMSLQPKPSLQTRGMSLIELLVVVTIVTLITGAVLVKHGTFNSTTLLNNLSYDIALSIRQAQAYGISVRSVGGTNFNAAYGVSFDPTRPDSYVLFQDLGASPNNAYDHDGDVDDTDDAEFVERYTLRRGHTISKFCRVGSSSVCSGAGLTVLNIVFRRPNPDAIVNGSPSSGACISVTDATGAAQRTVTVLTTGQISIANPGLCP